MISALHCCRVANSHQFSSIQSRFFLLEINLYEEVLLVVQLYLCPLMEVIVHNRLCGQIYKEQHVFLVYIFPS